MTDVTEVRLPTAQVVASVSPTMFADLCEGEPEFTRDGDLFVVTLPCVLDDAAVATVRDRLLSSDVGREEQRAAIRALLGTGSCDLCEFVAKYVLGDPA